MRKFYFRGVNNGTSSNKIKIKSLNPSNPATLAGGAISDSSYVFYITGDHWIVEDIIIRTGGKGLILDNSNNSEIRNVEIYDIGQEGLHVRDGSSNTLIDNVNVHDVGKLDDGFGEGIYVGSDNSVWWEGDGTDTGEKGLLYKRAVYNTTITNSTIGPNITAEPFDIKEGTENTIVENCIIYGSGVSGNNFADSHIDIKGNTARIRCNTFYQSNNSTIERAIMIVPRTNAGVANNLTAKNNYIHDNTFYLDQNSVEVVFTYGDSENTYAWDNTRIPNSGNYYQGDITNSAPGGYSATCGAPPSCDVPNGTSTSDISQVTAQLNWNSVSSASSYQVRWRVSGGSWVTISNLAGTSYTLAGLSADTDYDWQVRSNCAITNSSYSNFVNFTTQSSGGGGTCGGQNLAGPKELEICNITPNQNFTAGSSTPIVVNFSSDVNEVKYWYRTTGSAWNWIGKSTSAPYDINWGSISTSAIAIRARGATSNGNTSVYEVPIVVGNNSGGDYLPGTKNLEISNITANQSFAAGSSTPILVNYSEDVEEVKFWYRTSGSAWNWIGKNKAAPFSMDWDNIPTSAIAIRARGGTDNGNTNIVEIPIVVVSSSNDFIDDQPFLVPVERENQLMVYPNPVRQGSSLFIEGAMSEVNEVVLYNLSGLIINNYATGEGTSKVEIDLKHVPAGAYVLRANEKVYKIQIQ